MILILTLTFFVLLLIGVPIATSMGISAVTVLFFMDRPLVSVVQKLVTGSDSFTFLAIPLFILAGQLMNRAKISDMLFNFCNVLVGRIPGGLGHANVASSVIFAGMSGSAVADAGGLGAVEVKAMTNSGYDKEFSGAITAASAVIGPIIPPSIPMVVYAGITQVSVGKMFLGGVIPGLLMAVSLSVMVFIIAKKRKYPVREKMTFNEILKISVSAIIPLLTPIIILGGMSFGMFTATEAAAIAAAYALFIGVFVYREIDFKSALSVFRESLVTTANILYIIGCAAAFSYVMGQIGVADMMTDFIFSISKNPYIIIIIINILMFILGMFMETSAIQLMMVPIFLPMLNQLNINLIWFGIIIMITLMIGTVTPPVGVSLFTVSKVCDINLEKLTITTLPFLIPLVIVSLLCIFIPELVTWLPDLMISAQ